MLGVVVVLSGVLALAATSSVNYCGARICGNSNAHIFCRYPEGPSPKCVGYTETRLRSEDKIRLLSRLNRHRNVAASGGMQGYPPAGNMLKLRWVEELAREAQRWADQCRPPRLRRGFEEHDACRDLYSMHVGQCVASIVGQPPLSRVETMVDIWYIQGMEYKGNVTYYVPPRKGSKNYGDFAQIMWAKSYMVGCGHSRFMVQRQGRLQSVERLVCNIAPYGPQPTQPLWTVAAPTVLCPTHSRQSPVWYSLCDYKRTQNDIISLDPSTTLKDHLLLNTVLDIEENDTLNYFGSLDEIYLNKLAMVSLANMLTTQKYFDSMQKSEIIHFVDVIEFQSNDSTIEFVPQLLTAKKSRFVQNTLMTTANTSVSLQTETSKATQTKLELSLIGRPEKHFTKMTKSIKSTKQKLKKRKRIYDKMKFNNMTKNDIDAADVISNNFNGAEGPTFTENLSEKFQNVQLCYNLTEGACVHKVQSPTGVSETPSIEDHNFTVTSPYERHITSRHNSGLFDIQFDGQVDDWSFSGSGDIDEVRKQYSAEIEVPDHNFTVAPSKLLKDVTDERHLTSRRYFGQFDIQSYDTLDDQSFSGSGDVDEVRKQNSAEIEVPDHNFTVAPSKLLQDVTDERHLTSRRHFGLFDIQIYDMLDDQSFSGSGDDGDGRKQNSTTSSTTEDPESFRQRQEAMERIENELNPIDEKVRRDMQKNLEEMEATSREYAETPSNESESVDLVLNVLKLIPSWTENPVQEYSDIASCVNPSPVIVLALCFYYFLLLSHILDICILIFM